MEVEEAMNTFMKKEVEGEQRDNQGSEIDLEPGEILDAPKDGWGRIDQEPVQIIDLGEVGDTSNDDVTMAHDLRGESVDHEPGEMMEVADMDVDEVDQQTGSMDQDQDIPNPDGQVEGEASNRQAGYMKDVPMTMLAKVIVRSPTGQLTDHECYERTFILSFSILSYLITGYLI